MKAFHIFGMGNALVDTEVSVTHQDLERLSIDKGVMTLIDEDRYNSLADTLSKVVTHQASGGSGANTVIGAAQLGATCYYSCRVADDETGHFFIDDMHALGVKSNLDKAKLEAGKTGRCYVMITPDHDRTMNTFLGITATYSDAQLDRAALEQSDLLYIEGYLVASPVAQDAVVKAYGWAKEAGLQIAISLSDPNMVNLFGDGLRRMIGDGVDYLFCNEEEALAFTKTQEVSHAVEHLKHTANYFAVTLGASGSLVWDGATLHRIDPYTVDPVDTNGAGDAFAAGFLAAKAKGKSHEEAGYWGNVTAAHVVSQFGPRLTEQQLSAVKDMLT